LGSSLQRGKSRKPKKYYFDRFSGLLKNSPKNTRKILFAHVSFFQNTKTAT
jgi:hypothetical protein